MLTSDFKLLACRLPMIKIGASGWHYRHWRGPFYPQHCSTACMLDFYSRHFDTVEINNSFYRLPEPETFDLWRKQTPPGFQFAVKASRFITHNKKLADPDSALESFLPRAARLREKLGPILFQLPPKWNVNVPRLEQFLAALPKGNRWRYAFEFRNPTWLATEVYAVLRRYGAAFCIFDLAGFQTPLELSAEWSYVRLHGPGGKYQGSYSNVQLRLWAKRLRAWARKLKTVYIYFDNDQAGYAAQNAQQLRKLLTTSDHKNIG